MANQRTYSITINGITESVNAVNALNESLKTLESRINALSNKAVNVSASSGGGSKTSSTSSLSEEEKLQKQINQLEEKRIAHSKEIYQNYLAAKDVLKEVENDQKQIAAQERLTSKSYSNTIDGMKQELADIKAVMQTVDLGDTDQMDKMIQRANDLNSKLKEIEQSYGQFGRNVGNYESAANGFKKLTIEVNGVAREFDNAKQALMTLKKERDTLGVTGGRTTKEFQELDEVVKRLQSDIKDMSKSSALMDNLLDTMEGFAAIANVGQGLKGLFGVDDAEIQKSIKNLVALQNVLKGIETINKQIQTGEGIGGWIAPFSKGIDAATNKLLVYNRALLGTGKAAKVAAVGVNLFSKSLKTIGTLGIILILDQAIEKIMDWVEALKKADDATERSKKIQEEMGKGYAEATAKLSLYQNKVANFNGTRKEEKKLVAELNKELGDSLGTYKSLTEWKEVLKKKTDAYIQSMILEAEQQEILNELIAVYGERWNAIRHLHDDFSFGEQVQEFFAGSQSVMNDRKKVITELGKTAEMLEERLRMNAEAIQKNNKDNGLFDYAPQIKKNGKKTKDEVEEQQRTLNELQLRLMKDGLNKKLRQLDEEERQTINKLKQNGKKSADAMKKVEEYYAELRQNEINDYLKQLQLFIQETADKINKTQFEINVKKIEIQLKELKNEFDKLSMDAPIRNTLISNTEVTQLVRERNVTKENINLASTYQSLFNEAEATKKGDEFYNFLMNYLKSQNEELRDSILKIYYSTDGSEKEKQQAMFKVLEDMFEQEYANELLIVRNYTDNIDQTLTESLNRRLRAQRVYQATTREELLKSIQEQAKLNEQLLEEERNAADDAEKLRYQTVQLPLQKRKDELEEEIKNFQAKNDKEKESLEKLKADLAEIEKQMETQSQQHYDKLMQISEEYEAKVKTLKIENAKELSAEQEKYFDEQITNFRDAQSKMNELLSKQPKINAWGIINLSQTKKDYREIEDAARTALNNITEEKIRLEELWKKGLITPEAKNAITQQLNDLEADIKQGLQVVTTESKQTVGMFIQSINQYVQDGLQALQTIMNAVWDAQDAAFEREQEELDKWNDKLEEALDKQQEIIENHKNAVESIEEELADSRGDRRQHLIDQLNAEMQAQRAAQAEEQRIQKQKEAAEKRQEALEKKRKQAEYKRNLLSILVSTAMATANGLATQPFVPVGIAMGALATTLGMIQYALAAKAKPYAKGGQLDGGVAQGNRHRDGGIKVLGGRAEIEGGEFITNRITTQMNAPLLEFINSRKKRIDVSDLIDFYSSGKVKKNIMKMSPKNVFEDGGYIPPTLSNNIEIDDRLLESFEKYSNRPIYVSVVDISNKQEQIRQVQALAGIH